MISFTNKVLIAALCVLGANASNYIDEQAGKAKLKMNKDGKFKILQLTDLHMGEDQKKDESTISLINRMVADEKPDFIAIVSNLVSSFSAFQDGTPVESYWEKEHQKVASELTKLKTPWGFVPGYYDFQADGVSVSQMLEIEKNYRYSMASKTEELGAGHQFTYMVPVESYDEPDKIATRIWFFGTGKSNCLGVKGMDCVRRDQIKWYQKQTQQIPDNDINKRNGIAFMSIPLQEHMYLVNNFPVHGKKRDYSSCQALNTGLFSAIKKEGNISWVSVGTDHSTDFWGDLDGIKLAYGRKTGFSSHGPKFSQQGGRIFVMTEGVDEDPATWETYIYQNDGSIDNQKDLSYPTEFSWVKNAHCAGSEEDRVKDTLMPYDSDNAWLPGI